MCPRPRGARDWITVQCTACNGLVNRENAEFIDGEPYGSCCGKRVRENKERLASFKKKVVADGSTAVSTD
jgi:hypothetical protein